VLVARGLGVKGLEDYEPPSEQIASMFEEDDQPDAEPAAAGEERRLQVLRFMEATGGGA
jgi:hypothetical protein